MARGCFEVDVLEMCFWRTTEAEQKVKLVSEKIEDFLTKKASNTRFNISGKESTEFDPYVIVTINFSKSISSNTIINFLKSIDDFKYSSITIKVDKKKVKVEI